MVTPTILIHGGAGAVVDGDDTRTSAFRAGLTAATEAGRAALADGAVAAVTAAVRVLEDDPQFNAGIGSVLDAAGEAACSASAMDGRDGRAGAVAGIRRVRHPVDLAALLMDHRHCFMIASGAEALAQQQGLEPIDPDALVTAERRQHLARVRAGGGTALDHDVHDAKGTVGAVALDAGGGLAAATSTGGLTNQLPGRLGDSAVIGGGTWADQRVAVSATGMGEAFIRAVFAHRVADLLDLAGLDLATACDRTLARVGDLGGRGGCIALGADGTWVMPCTTAGMLRAVAVGSGPVVTAIGRDERCG